MSTIHVLTTLYNSINYKKKKKKSFKKKKNKKKKKKNSFT